MDNTFWIKYDNDLKKDYKNNDNSLGVVYVIEYGDNLKIGSTTNIVNRYYQLKHMSEDYHSTKIGNCYFTKLHQKFTKNEHILHDVFKDKRINNTELFSISLDDFLM